MKHYDFNLGADENYILQYLQDHNEHFISEMEITRRADGRRRFQEDPYWAHSALSLLIDLGYLDTDGQGRYRLHIEESEPEKPATENVPARKFIDPRLRAILEQSGKKFDLSRYA